MEMIRNKHIKILFVNQPNELCSCIIVSLTPLLKLCHKNFSPENMVYAYALTCKHTTDHSILLHSFIKARNTHF